MQVPTAAAQAFASRRFVTMPNRLLVGRRASARCPSGLSALAVYATG
jgi:hypothetical protein